jgi:nitroreductase
MDLLDFIRGRRSVREFTSEDVSVEDVESVLEAGRWAPSGLNNQPWRFVVVRDVLLKEGLSRLTEYGSIVVGAPVDVAVFLDGEVVYDRTKDVLAVGACIQNMLLEAHSLALGAVWLGEILKNRDKVSGLLETPAGWELMGVVALGHPTRKKRVSERRPLRELVLGGKTWPTSKFFLFYVISPYI